MENNNEERNEVFYETPIYEQPPEKKSSGKGFIIFLVILLFVVAVGGVFAFTGVGDSLFATKGERFVQLLTVDQKILDLGNFDSKSAQVNSELKVDIDKIMADVGTTPTGIGAIVLENKEIIKGKDYSDTMIFSATDIKNARIELQIAKTGDLVGVHVPGITEGFIGVDIGDLEGLMKNLEELGVELNTESESKEEFTEKQQKEMMKLFERYGKVALVVLEDFVEKGSKVEIKADGKSDKATEYKLTLNPESIIKTAIAVDEELLANKKDVDKFIEWGLIEEDDKEEFITSIEENLEELKKVVEEESFEEYMGEGEIFIKVYEKHGKNIATVIEVENQEFGLYYFEPEKKSSSIIFKYQEDDNKLFVSLDMKEDDGATDGKLGLKVDADGEEHELTLCETKVERLNKIEDEMVKIEKGNIILLNTATEEDLETFVENCTKNAQEYLTKMMAGELPEVEEEEEPEPEQKPSKKDDEPKEEPSKKNEKDEEKVVDNSSSTKKASGKLAEVQKMYDKIKIGMTKSEVINVLGQPSDDRANGDYRHIYYEDDDIELLNIMLEDEKVIKVEIELYSDSYDGICLSKDLGAKISDLNEVIVKVKDGMTMKEVEKILGDKYFESEKWDTGEKTYTWYDTNENYARIEFKDGKVDLIYNVHKSY